MSWLSLLSLLACSETQKTENKQIPPDKQLEVKLDIESDHLKVTLANLSPEEIRVWEFNNSWGWETISFHLKENKWSSTIYSIKRSARDWTMMGANYAKLLPEESYGFQTVAGDGWWDLDEELARLKNDSFLVQAIYNSPTSPEAEEDSVFIGSVQSEWVTSQPPHHWLFPAQDSVLARLKQMETWYWRLNANNDSMVSFGFYLSKEYLDLSKRLDKYESRTQAQKLIDELNDLMFSGGDHVHNPSQMADFGEVGHFFSETRKELDKRGVRYHWDAKKVRYVLGEQ